MKSQLRMNFSPKHTSYTKKKFRLVIFTWTKICFSLFSCLVSKNLSFKQDSKAQVTALQLIIGTLQRMHVFGVENRDTLTHKATGVFPHDMLNLSLLNSVVSAKIADKCKLLLLQYSAKLLKKPDQCRAVYACSHLFWLEDHETIQDGERYIFRLSNRTQCIISPSYLYIYFSVRLESGFCVV